MQINNGMRLAVVLTAAAIGLAACGVETTTSTAAEAPGQQTEHTDDISKGVEPDPAAVALLPEEIKKKGVLTVPMDLTSPPTTFIASDNKTPIGLNPDMARLVAAKLGLKLEIKNIGFDTLVPGLEGDRYDFTSSTMSANPDRLKVLDMITYFKNGSSIAVAHGNPDGLTNETLCGKRVGVQSGSVQETIRLPKLSADTCESKGEPAIEAVVLPSVQDALTQLASKRIDGVFYDTTSLVWADHEQPETFSILEPELASNEVAMALKKGSPLTPALQAAVQSIIDSPEYEEVLGRWGLDHGAVTQATLIK
jgi:polar amino acid transport system substrate-binding protein